MDELAKLIMTLGPVGVVIKALVEGVKFLGIRNVFWVKTFVVGFAAALAYLFGVDVFAMVGLKQAIAGPQAAAAVKLLNVVLISSVAFYAHDKMAEASPRP